MLLLTGWILDKCEGEKFAVHFGRNKECESFYGILDLSGDYPRLINEWESREWKFQQMDVLEVVFPSLGLPIIVTFRGCVDKIRSIA